jgi:hypothetical protein
VNPIIIEALLVRGDGERVRVILAPYCLDFDADDVLDFEELPLPPDVAEGSAVAARVTLRPGARLLGLRSADAYRDVLWNRGLPFTLATRPTVAAEVGAAMVERENAFFAARGLTEPLS